MKSSLLIFITIASVNVALAQAPPPASSNPSAASSPHQRDTTSKTTKEAPAPSNAEPSAASSPHQKQVTEGTDKSNAKQDKMINDCVTKRQSESSSLSKQDANKACMADMKKDDAH